MQAYFRGESMAGIPGPAGPDGNPVGTIIAYMGTIAPKDYLICDGSIHEISAYPNLAKFFETQFSSKNYFGGNGTTTFAVPDMRNLFLRGYHGDSEEQLSGEIGEKQEATKHIVTYLNFDDSKYYPTALRNTNPTDFDKVFSVQTGKSTVTLQGTREFGGTGGEFYSSRPVNMAVLYCIKAVDSVSLSNNYPSIEEYDTEDGWHVRKYSDGYVEMFGKFDHTVLLSNWITWGNAFYQEVDTHAYPVNLINIYSEDFSINPELAYIIILGESLRLSNNCTKKYTLIRLTMLPDDLNTTLEYHVTGRWK